MKTVFLHKDEFNEKFTFEGAKFPSAYISNSSGLTLLISQEEMNSLTNLDDLIELVDKKLAENIQNNFYLSLFYDYYYDSEINS